MPNPFDINANDGYYTGAGDIAANAPSAVPPDFSGFFMPFLEEQGRYAGIRPTREYSGGINLREELKRQGISKETIARLEKELGSKKFNMTYGRNTAAYNAIINRVAYIKKYELVANKDKSGKSKYERSFTNLLQELKGAGEAQYTIGSEAIPGLGGLTLVEKADALEAYLKKNPKADLNKLTQKDLTKIFGVEYEKGDEKLVKEDLKELKDFAASDEYKNYATAQEIFRTGLESQRQAQQAFLDTQKKVNAKGYAEKTVAEQFKPAETELAQYFEAQPGMAESQAALDVGANEAALGRTGYDRAKVELARQGGLAKERLGAQKAAAVGQLQQYIDMKNPMEALRYGMTSGQSAMGNLDYFKNKLLQPYAQVFPLAAQNYQLGLTPFTMQQQVPSGPGWGDYAMQGGALAGQALAAYYSGGTSLMAQGAMSGAGGGGGGFVYPENWNTPLTS